MISRMGAQRRRAGGIAFLVLVSGLVTQAGTAQHARAADTTHLYDYLNSYVSDLENVIDLDVIRAGNIRMGVDPLGGAGVHYWAAIAERHKLDLTVVNKEVDPTFRFMTVDWDGKIRMDPSSNYAMRGLIDLKDRFDIAYACDTDHDRHGIVTRSAGLWRFTTCFRIDRIGARRRGSARPW